MKTPAWHFDDDLREAPDRPAEWETHLAGLEAILQATRDPEEMIKLSEQAAFAARVLRKLESARKHAERALAETQRTSDKTRTVQNYIRLAHVHQWRGTFDEARRLFLEAEALINDRGLFDGLRGSFHQHRGKMYFDMGDYATALAEFEAALKIREKLGAAEDLLHSSRLAITETKRRLAT